MFGIASAPLNRQKMPCSCTFRHVSIEQDQTADLIKIIPFNSMCDSNNRIVGIYIHKMYRKFGGHTNCKIHLSCLSQFSLISILLNINKALKHCDCQRIITNAYGQCRFEARYDDHRI